MHSIPFNVHWLPANLASMGLHGLHFTVCQDNTRLSCAECLKEHADARVHLTPKQPTCSLDTAVKRVLSLAYMTCGYCMSLCRAAA